MIRQVELFLCAVQFLTRLPMPELKRFEPDWVTRSARYFPLVGQVVGGLSAVVLIVAAQLWGGWVPVLLALAVGLLITGCFHEDGLADSFDGLGGGQTPERRLEIMKDSRLGTYGALAVVMVLALKAAALATLPAPWMAATALLAAHGVGRAAAVVTMRLTPYAGDGDGAKWKPLPRGVRTWETLVAVALAAWPLVFLPLPAVSAGLAFGAVLAALLALAARRLIGGHTGDVLGGVEQLFELGFLLGVAAVLA
ncbi:adenosylcobinamide-GDP ribazoletransferase [Caulobacter mirabilis]|uniref:Adenosylcobinamide-GDP ribazoletransferase n=1 Tax=Caulobacter mirabilis TaxID=69666 RepID=A0A2D2B068_9CAUL|nr:adenosylcobinamide-GDP ribazoletransferase [Caulobacter mirabilis]ATQ43567.1 adenosylcobinamide-GDP ribazoletransferase [Caulobacter mirabilis]